MTDEINNANDDEQDDPSMLVSMKNRKFEPTRKRPYVERPIKILRSTVSLITGKAVGTVYNEFSKLGIKNDNNFVYLLNLMTYVLENSNFLKCPVCGTYAFVRECKSRVEYINSVDQFCRVCGKCRICFDVMGNLIVNCIHTKNKQCGCEGLCK